MIINKNDIEIIKEVKVKLDLEFNETEWFKLCRGISNMISMSERHSNEGIRYMSDEMFAQDILMKIFKPK